MDTCDGLRRVAGWAKKYGGFVAGGALRSLFTASPVRDYDVFFRHKDGYSDALQDVGNGRHPFESVLGSSMGYAVDHNVVKIMTRVGNAVELPRVELVGFRAGEPWQVLEGFDFRFCMMALDGDQFISERGAAAAAMSKSPSYVPFYSPKGRATQWRNPYHSHKRLRERWFAWGLDYASVERESVGIAYDVRLLVSLLRSNQPSIDAAGGGHITDSDLYDQAYLDERPGYDEDVRNHINSAINLLPVDTNATRGLVWERSAL